VVLLRACYFVKCFCCLRSDKKYDDLFGDMTPHHRGSQRFAGTTSSNNSRGDDSCLTVTIC
jgi:hypothetical protein